MSYEIVRIIGSESKQGIQRESTLVKINPTVCRGEKSFDLYEIDHVIVEAMRIMDGDTEYEETHVVASDENGTILPSILYLGTKALSVAEAMFGIGEHNYVPMVDNDESGV